MKKLWFDDIRRPPDSTWDWARTVDEAKERLRETDYDVISLDHDMGLHNGDPDEVDADLRVAPDAWEYEDGMDLVKWMCLKGIVIPTVFVHSWNHYGAANMAAYIDQYAKTVGKDCSITVKAFDPQSRKGGNGYGCL